MLSRATLVQRTEGYGTTMTSVGSRPDLDGTGSFSKVMWRWTGTKAKTLIDRGAPSEHQSLIRQPHFLIRSQEFPDQPI